MGFKLRFWFTSAEQPAVAFATQGAGAFGDLVARKLSREVGYPVTCHPNADLPLGMVAGSRHVWRCTWFDEKTETFREGHAVLAESFPVEVVTTTRSGGMP
jgi:hypothetical protein